MQVYEVSCFEEGLVGLDFLHQQENKWFHEITAWLSRKVMTIVWEN